MFLVSSVQRLFPDNLKLETLLQTGRRFTLHERRFTRPRRWREPFPIYATPVRRDLE